jgi:ubiquinone biosynthesis protein
MRILQQLAGFLARKYATDRSHFAGLAETLTEIRLLLEHEVNFRREQRTLAGAQRFYASIPGVRVPRLIEPLSTASVTALTEENGVKVTAALRRRPGPRARLAERLAEALIAVPAFAWRKEAIFHADPHAGNLLYDQRRDELVILDWALKESLSRDQRRHIVLLVLMTMLRDPDGIWKAIEQLRLHRAADDRAQAGAVRACVSRFLGTLSLLHAPGPMDALHLLDSVAREGIRFPAPLIMFRKAAFTLDGVVEDVAGAAVRMDSVLGRYAMRHWAAAGVTLWSLLSPRDWIALEWSALTLAARLPVQALSRYWAGLLLAPKVVRLQRVGLSGAPAKPD